MIRGPVLPQLRDSLWSLVSSRLSAIESGLTLVLEAFDCSEGQLGAVEGLARDAAGAPVLVLLAVEGDLLLSARTLSAGQFVQRVGDALIRAVPEACFCPGASGRVIVVGTESAAASLQQVALLPIEGLAVSCLEPFRVAGSERFAVRWLATAAHAPEGVAATAAPLRLEHPAFVVAPAREALWARLREICTCIDSAVQLHGDRYSQRIAWRGQQLGEVRADDTGLVASAATGVVVELRDAQDVRRFGDQLLRAYVRRAGFDRAPSTSTVYVDSTVDDRLSALRSAAASRATTPSVSTLRSSVAAARLSPEELSAFGESASWADESAGGFSETEDRDQASSATGAPPSAGRSD